MSNVAQKSAQPTTDENDDGVEIEIAIQCDEIIQQQARRSAPATTPPGQ